jgi:hypothetical protein
MEPQPNGCRITHFFRYEDQPRLRAFLEERLSVTLALGRENVSPEIPLDLSAEVETRLRRKCAAEFELYESIP